MDPLNPTFVKGQRVLVLPSDVTERAWVGLITIPEERAGEGWLRVQSTDDSLIARWVPPARIGLGVPK